MHSTITERGQTAIPAALRKRYGLKPHMKLEWIDLGRTIAVTPVPTDPIKAMHGMLKGSGLTQALLESRRQERERERRLEKRA